MAKENKDTDGMPFPVPGENRFPRLLTPAQVKEVLNVGMPTLYELLRSGELRGVQLGGRRMWRVSEDDLAAYLERAYKETQDRIAAGSIEVEPAEGED